MLEDNDPVIQICIKGRNPTLRHVPRVHRVNIDATYERIREDPGIFMRYWPTHAQFADILTKGSFTASSWTDLVNLLQIRVPSDIKEIRRLQLQKGSLGSDGKTLPSHLSIDELLDNEDSALDGNAKAATTKPKVSGNSKPRKKV